MKPIELLKEINYEMIRQLYDKKGWPWWTGTYDLNLSFIRTSENIINTFNDIEIICFTDEYNQHQCIPFFCTTDPGIISLLNPPNSEGCAVILPGYYHGVWTPGLHHGTAALIQVGDIQILRDFDRDKEIDWKTGRRVVATSDCQIRNHYARTDRVVKNVDNWSAGCCVVPDCRNMSLVTLFVQRQIKYNHGNKISFGLLQQAAEMELQ